MSTAPARVSPLWLVPPALLFASAWLVEGSETDNAVYRGELLAAGAVQALLFTGYCLLAAALSRRPPRVVLAIRRVDRRVVVRLAAPLLAALVVVNVALEQVTHAGEEQGIAPTHTPRDSDQWWLLGAAFLVFVVLAPLSEELFFRGLGFAAFGAYAVPLTAALFALAHALPVLLLPVFVAGLALGELRRRTGSIVPGLIVHGGLNGLGLVLALATAGA